MNRRAFLIGAVGIIGGKTMAQHAIPIAAKTFFKHDQVTLKRGQSYLIDLISENRYPGYHGYVYVPQALFHNQGGKVTANALYKVDHPSAWDPINEVYSGTTTWTREPEGKRWRMEYEDGRPINKYHHEFLGANMLVQFSIRVPKKPALNRFEILAPSNDMNSPAKLRIHIEYEVLNSHQDPLPHRGTTLRVRPQRDACL